MSFISKSIFSRSSLSVLKKPSAKCHINIENFSSKCFINHLVKSSPKSCSYIQSTRAYSIIEDLEIYTIPQAGKTRKKYPLPSFESLGVDRELVEHKLSDFADIIDGDPVKTQRVEQILQLYEITKYENGYVPSKLTPENIRDMLSPMRDGDVSYFRYLYLREFIQLKKKLQKRPSQTFLNLQKKHLENKIVVGIQFDENGRPVYGKWMNSYFLRFSKGKTGFDFIPKAIEAAFFGQKLVVDFDYDDCMRFGELKNTIFQCALGYSINKISKDPYDIWFCNVRSDFTRSAIATTFGQDKDSILTKTINITDRSYLELFPDKKLIYLSPNAPKSMTSYDHDAVYIIGGLNDRASIRPLSFAKCKREGIECERLPLDEHFRFKGHKVLTIDQVWRFMQMVKEGTGIYDALKDAIPSRKLKTDEEISELQWERETKIKQKPWKNHFKSS